MSQGSPRLKTSGRFPSRSRLSSYAVYTLIPCGCGVRGVRFVCASVSCFLPCFALAFLRCLLYNHACGGHHPTCPSVGFPFLSFWGCLLCLVRPLRLFGCSVLARCPVLGVRLCFVSWGALPALAWGLLRGVRLVPITSLWLPCCAGCLCCPLACLRGLPVRRLLAAAWCSFVGFPAAVRPVVSQAARCGVPVWWGSASPGCPRGVAAAALLARSRRLAVSGRLVACVAFVGAKLGRGSFFSLQLCARRVPVFVVCSRSCALPQLLGGGVWVRASLAGVPAWRWLPRRSKLARGVIPIPINS